MTLSTRTGHSAASKESHLLGKTAEHSSEICQPIVRACKVLCAAPRYAQLSDQGAG